jgi:hypothetical protein
MSHVRILWILLRNAMAAAAVKKIYTHTNIPFRAKFIRERALSTNAIYFVKTNKIFPWSPQVGRGGFYYIFYILSNIFYQIYRVGDSARCRINFARKGILLWVF